MLAFCTKCDNIMVLKRKSGRNGTFVCRTCNATKRLKVCPIEIREEIRTMVPSVPGYY